MNDVKRHSRNLRSENTRMFNLSSLESESPVREIKVKRDFERRLERFDQEYEETNEDEKMEKLESFVRDDYIRNNTKRESKGLKFLLNFKSLFIGLILSLTCLYFVFTYILNSATLEIEPKSFESAVDTEIVLSNTVSPGSYEFVEINKEVISKLGNLEEKKISTKATGTLTIYNNYSEASQKLVKNTRFESTEGKVFRVTDSVNVPGMSEGKSGVVKVNVIADFVGDEYNVPAGKFTIPGFKGSARYAGFYAESESKMHGGSNSFKKVVDQDKINSLRGAAELEIAKLVNSDIPKVSKSGYVLASKVVQIIYTDNLDNVINGKEDSYKVNGQAKVMIVNEKALASAIASKINTAYLGEKVSFVDPKKESIDLNFASTSGNILSDASMLLRANSPKTSIVYDIDETKIAQAVAGKSSSKESFSKLMSLFVGVQKAKPTIAPFWLENFPTSPSKIKIVNVSN